MSTIFRDHTAERAPIDVYSQRYGHVTCAVCGQPADAVWDPDRAGGYRIGICAPCSLKALPALIADAMRARGRTTPIYQDTKRRMIDRFHEAAALALANAPETPEERAFRERQEAEVMQFVLEQATESEP